MAIISLPSQATHIVGGELYYRYLGNNTYRITLKVYRDCGPANVNQTYFDTEAAIGVYQLGVLQYQLMMSLGNAEIDFLPVTLENPCFVLPPDLCVEEAIYEEDIVLPESPFIYDLVYQRCCRNPSIVNIQFPENSGATFTTQIPGTNILPNGQNSNPVFNNFPPVALCTGVPFVFDHSATDQDGDELVYEFCSPMLGGTPDEPMPVPPGSPPFANVVYEPGFSFNNPISANPPFNLDPVSGELTGTPTLPGQYVIGVCVSEYRNGVLLSRTNRDFQFNVVTCDPNIIAAIPSQTQFCEGLTFSFGNNSVNSSFYFWDFGDPATEADTSNLAQPTYTFPDTGYYEVMLVANPGWPCADTAITGYDVQPLLFPVVINSGYSCENGQTLFHFEAGGEIDQENATYFWDFGPGSEPSSSNSADPQDIYLGPPGGNYTISLTVTANGCSETNQLQLALPQEPIAGIAEQESFCDGFEYTFGNDSQFATSYVWNFGVPGTDADVSIETEPVYVFPEPGVYAVSLIAMAENTCPDTAVVNFEISTLLAPFFERPPTECLNDNSFSFEALGASFNSTEINWDFGDLAIPSSSSLISPDNISYPDTGWWEVNLTITENGCTRSYTDSVLVLPNPVLDFEISGSEGCIPLVVSFTDSSYAATPLSYAWDFGDGTGSTEMNPVHEYNQSGTYDISLTISTQSGCIASDTFVLPDGVWVYPDPVAGFSVEPGVVNILQPEVNITDLSINAVECNYDLADGGVSDECDFTYSFTDGGLFAIIQTVYNEFGCPDSAIRYVTVEGFVFYAPNAFTPDGDGTNDLFLPIALGVSEYLLEIYNRWGEKVFETTDRFRGWDGKYRDLLSQDGVYIYKVRLEDMQSIPHEYVGHVTLLR